MRNLTRERKLSVSVASNAVSAVLLRYSACVAAGIEALYLLCAFDKLDEESKDKVIEGAANRSCAFLDDRRCMLYYARPLCCRVSRCVKWELPFWMSKFYDRIGKFERRLELGFEWEIVNINDFIKRLAKKRS